jgi:Tc5 transposase DNA-binding domain
MNPPPPKEEVTSPGKKSKAKLPDFEKTLTNWVKNQQKKGLPVTDEDLRKQARVFSFSRSDQALLSSPSWLEKFKQKNGLGKYSDSVDSSTTSLSETPLNASPASSSGGLVSPPMSAIDEDSRRRAVKGDQSDDYFDLESRDVYGESPHESASEIEQALSGPIMSPLSPGLSRGGHELPDLPMNDTFTASSSSRQRSQTFPHLTDLSSNSRPISSGKQAGLPVRAMTSSLETRPTAIDPRQTMKRHKSVPDIHDAEPIRFTSMQPPPLPRSADMSPVSNPASPAEDDNIRALHHIKRLLEEHPGVADSDDYIAIGKLMEKLKLLRSPSITPHLPGGMHPVDVLDSPRMSKSKKRTIMGIST